MSPCWLCFRPSAHAVEEEEEEDEDEDAAEPKAGERVDVGWGRFGGWASCKTRSDSICAVWQVEQPVPSGGGRELDERGARAPGKRGWDEPAVGEGRELRVERAPGKRGWDERAGASAASSNGTHRAAAAKP